MRRLEEVSDPRHERYGKHLSQAEVHDLTAPAAADLAAVRQFLQSHGVEDATPNGDVQVVRVSIETAEKLLSTEYHELRHSSGAVAHRVVGDYHLPPRVAAAVDFVAPTVHVPGVAPKRPASTVSIGYENKPKTLRELYNIGNATGTSANSMAVTAFLEQTYSSSALHEYFRGAETSRRRVAATPRPRRG